MSFVGTYGNKLLKFIYDKAANPLVKIFNIIRVRIAQSYTLRHESIAVGTKFMPWKNDTRMSRTEFALVTG
ncbi:hypothetical protein DFQ28_001139, partial [Apophysomyces sp. BC1034]